MLRLGGGTAVHAAPTALRYFRPKVGRYQSGEKRMVRKLGIVTIVDHANFGNRLQNYAVQEVLKSLGFEPETIISHRFDGLDPGRRIRYLWEKLLVSASETRVFDHFRGRAARALKDRKHGSLIRAKAASGVEFSRNHIKQSGAFLSPRGLRGARVQDYDYFVVGSDQVWKPAYRNGAGPEFLDFAPPEKRIAYSASFGVSVIPPIFVTRYREGIRNMAAVSVREFAGRQIVETICGFTPEVTVDPTLLVAPAQWQKLATPHPRKPTSGYVLNYFLSRPDAATELAIDALAGQGGLESVKLADVSHPEFYDAGPAEFLDFVAGSSIMCTDSFHGVIFSIIFGRPFVVFTRAGGGATMNSRIETLLESFGLQDRLYRGGRIDQEGAYLDHGELEGRLASSRERSLAYLRSALACPKACGVDDAYLALRETAG